MKIQVEVFSVVTPYSVSVVVGYERFGDPCCLHLQGEHNTTRCHNPEELETKYRPLSKNIRWFVVNSQGGSIPR